MERGDIRSLSVSQFRLALVTWTSLNQSGSHWGKGNGTKVHTVVEELLSHMVHAWNVCTDEFPNVLMFINGTSERALAMRIMGFS